MMQASRTRLAFGDHKDWQRAQACEGPGRSLAGMEALDEVGQLIFGIDLDALWVQRPSQLRRILLVIDAGDLRCGEADHL